MSQLPGRDSNPRPSGYEPDELPDCSTRRYMLCLHTFCYLYYIKNKCVLCATFIFTESSNLSNVSNTATTANAKVSLNGVKCIIGFTQKYPDRVDRALQMQYDTGEIASITFNNTGIWYDFYNGTTWEQVWKFNRPT